MSINVSYINKIKTLIITSVCFWLPRETTIYTVLETYLNIFNRQCEPFEFGCFVTNSNLRKLIELM